MSIDFLKSRIFQLLTESWVQKVEYSYLSSFGSLIIISVRSIHPKYVDKNYFEYTITTHDALGYPWNSQFPYMLLNDRKRVIFLAPNIGAIGKQMVTGNVTLLCVDILIFRHYGFSLAYRVIFQLLESYF